jgi:hypothetical protein
MIWEFEVCVCRFLHLSNGFAARDGRGRRELSLMEGRSCPVAG